MMGWSPRCYIPSFVEIGAAVPEKKIFGLKYNVGDTTAIWQMNKMLSTCNTEEGGCIPHITNMINCTTKAYKDKIIFLV